MKSYSVFLLLSFLTHLILFSVAFSPGSVEKPILNLEVRSSKTASLPLQKPEKEVERRRENPPPKIRDAEPEPPLPEKPPNPAPPAEPKEPPPADSPAPAQSRSTSVEPASETRPSSQDTGTSAGKGIQPSGGGGTGASTSLHIGAGAGDGNGTGTDSSQNSASILQAYLTEVFKKIDSRKEYPRMAVRLGQEGKVDVEFSITSDGKAEEIHIRKGSGFRLLDESAMEAIRKASPFPPIPESLKQQKISVSITLLFTLSSQN